MNPLSDIVILLFSETAQIEAIKQQMSQEISDLRKEKVKLQHTASDRLQTEHVRNAFCIWQENLFMDDWHHSWNAFVQIFNDGYYLGIYLQVFLETQLDMEKNRVDQERKKLTLAHEQIAQLVGIFYSILKVMSVVDCCCCFHKDALILPCSHKECSSQQ